MKAYDFIFLFDANLNTGAGHLQRCKALIESLLLKGYMIACVGEFSDRFEIEIKELGIDYTNLENSRNLKNSHGQITEQTKCLVVDQYSPLDEILGEHFIYDRLVLFDDECIFSDSRPNLVISPFGDYSKLTSHYPNAEILVGLEYLTFRSEVKKLIGLKQRQSLSINPSSEGYRILVSLGATDQTPILLQICKVLQDLEQYQLNITVMSAVKIDLSDEFEVKVGFDSEFLVKACSYDLVICGMGQSFLELSALGQDVLGIVLVENQRKCADLAKHYGASVLDDIANQTELMTLIGKELSRLSLEGNGHQNRLAEQLFLESDNLISHLIKQIH